MKRYVWLAALVTSVAVFQPVVAHAESAQDKTVKRLKASHDSERYERKVPGKSIKAGGARILVNAPLAKVRRNVLDYAHYATYISRFKRSRVVSKNKRFTDVYLQVPILHGVANVWAVARFGKPIKKANGTEVIRGRMMQGNVKDFRAVWYLTPIDAKTTLLRSEILIVPKIPVPGSMVTGELAYAADVAVTAMRNRSERKH